MNPYVLCCGSLLVALLLPAAARWLSVRLWKRNDFWEKGRMK